MNQSHVGVLQQVWERKVPFFAVFAIMFMASYGVLVLVDFVPEPPAEEVLEEEGETDATSLTATSVAEQVVDDAGEVLAIEGSNEVADEMSEVASAPTTSVAAPAQAAVLPTTIIIDKLDRSVPVLNPTSRSVADLDAALLNGVVRHPDSASLSQTGTVFLLGHSSYLPNVFNKNFQAFNGIQKLEWGDVIRVRSDDTEFIYRVDKVFEAKASEVIVPIAGETKRLTLATCNSFASKDDRYIVEAALVSTRSL